MSFDLAVIGGGPSGLAAAWSLLTLGHRVTLYERSSEVGGLLRTRSLEGLPVDVAVQLLGSYYSETFRLAHEAGLSDLLVRAPGRDALWREGRSYPLTYGSVASMASSSALPTTLKFRLASRYLLFLRRHGAELDPAEPLRALALDTESIGAWGERELGRDFVELLVYPQLAAYYGTTPESTSSGFYHALARAGLDLELYGVRGGMGALARGLGDALIGRGISLELGVEVERVTEVGESVVVGWDAGEAIYDGVVIALPAPHVLRLLDPPAPLREWLEGVHFVEEGIIALSVEGFRSPNYFGLSFPRSSRPGAEIAAICHQSQKGVGLGGEGRDTLVVIPTPMVMDQIMSAEPRVALEMILPAVEEVYPGIRSKIKRARVFTFPAGRASFYPGYLSHLSVYDPTWSGPHIALAGDYLIAPTVEGAVRSGFRSARSLSHSLRGG